MQDMVLLLLAAEVEVAQQRVDTAGMRLVVEIEAHVAVGNN